MNAKDVLVRAVKCDTAGRILEAQGLYQDGIAMLMNLVMDEEDMTKKRLVYERIKEYIDRAEQIKDRLNRHMIRGELINNISIVDDSDGNSYKTLFGKYLNNEVREVLLEEPYLHEKYHFQNLIVFFELLIKNCRNMKYIRIVTRMDTKTPENQKDKLKQIMSDVNKRDIVLSVKYENTLHDRKIVLSNGYIIKIGRGLHFFKPTHPMYSLGLLDYDYRRCLQTDIDIWRVKNFAA